MQVVQSRDFHPDHNALIEAKIKEFAAKQNYPLDHSYIEAYAGSGDVVQKLTAAVQAGDAPDILIHNLGSSQLHFLDIIDEVDALEKDLEKFHGKLNAASTRENLIDGKWWAIPHFIRAGGFWVRQSAFKAAGIDPYNDLGDLGKLRDAAMKITKGAGLHGLGHDRQPLGRWRHHDPQRHLHVRRPAHRRDGPARRVEQGAVSHEHAARAQLLQGHLHQSAVGIDAAPGVAGWTDPSNNEAWLGGKIGITNNAGTVFAKAVLDKNPVADDTFLILQPKGLGPAARSLAGAGGAMCFYFMKGGKNRDAAEQLVRYLMAPDVQKQMFKISTGYVYPARDWGWTEPEITESAYAKHVTDNWKKIAGDPSGYLGSPYPGPSPQIGALDNSNFLTDMFGEILGGKSPEDALASAHAKAVQTFKEFGAKGE